VTPCSQANRALANSAGRAAYYDQCKLGQLSGSRPPAFSISPSANSLANRWSGDGLSSKADEITASAWSDLVANKRGQRAMAAALILRSKGYPRVHVGGGRVAGPGASAWRSVLSWASQELLVDIGLNAARHPDRRSPAAAEPGKGCDFSKLLRRLS
jgi:hypothetical protein